MKEIEQELFKILVQCAKNGETICYSAIWKEKGLHTSRKVIGSQLLTVGHYCIQEHLPNLGSLVVLKSTGRVSKGYFEEFYRNLPESSQRAVEEQDRQKCFSFKNWPTF